MISINSLSVAPLTLMLINLLLESVPFRTEQVTKNRPWDEISPMIFAMHPFWSSTRNEIAQSECANGCKFVNYWLHNGFVTINKEKMSSYSNALKVPMIILVIFVHENLNLTNDGYLGLMLAAISNVAVPVFFLISGYYFFYGHQFCKEEYFRKLIKRSRTLLLPYLIWNLLPMMNIVAGNLFSIIFRGRNSSASCQTPNLRSS